MTPKTLEELENDRKLVDVKDARDPGAYGSIRYVNRNGKTQIEVDVHHDAAFVNLADLVRDGQIITVKAGDYVYRIHRERGWSNV